MPVICGNSRVRPKDVPAESEMKDDAVGGEAGMGDAVASGIVGATETCLFLIKLAFCLGERLASDSRLRVSGSSVCCQGWSVQI